MINEEVGIEFYSSTKEQDALIGSTLQKTQKKNLRVNVGPPLSHEEPSDGGAEPLAAQGDQQ